MGSLASALVLLASSALLGAQGTDLVPLDPHADYRGTRSDPVTYEVDLRAIVTAPSGTKLLRVWFPVPPTDSVQQVTGSTFTTFPASVQPSLHVEPVHGNTFAYFELPDPQGAQIIEHRFTVTTCEVRWELDPARVGTVAEWPEGFAPYLRSEQQAVVIDDRVRSIAAEVVPARSNPAADMVDLMAWVDANLSYDHADASLAASSQHALDERAGHCSDYHGLCASLGRTLGVPTRVAYGINPFPKASPTHCKLEAFLPGYGWVSFDVSETQKLTAAIEERTDLDAEAKQALVAAALARLRSGFRDSTWFLQTRGTDYELAPPSMNGRVAVVRTIHAEADGVPLAEPDPSNVGQTAFTWMTAHRYVADRKVPYPFQDVSTLATPK